ncbi:WD40 repeat protein [Plasmopara halstedii]|uniref:WD40 repeat protein n=1 Tax=Plasmopara halstedii TaxID=4781 RepID=A0A0P1AAW9_PLAHL|nr:WD40 repeat protein [Plasmopara halstedii]CEG37512.1 WD40 repeat protein [Plasmopara halstedii]|eukprot:XP_024573881.1 WD40 repeat protein [Plasmopara halstedii]
MNDIVSKSPRSRLILERVLGLTALSNAQVAVNPASGELAYAAGCIVVIYNLRRDKQVRYYRVDKFVSCLCFSPSGHYLAIGEKGYRPAITIWDGTDGTLCAELQRHQYGVGCMAFSHDGRFLISAGLDHDKHLYAWELIGKHKDAVRRLDVTIVGCAFVEDKILDADYCQAGNFFVTVGKKHFKYWFLDDKGSFLLTGLRLNDLPELQHRDAVLNAKTSATFTGVGCGYGSCELKTFASTLDGTLCCFGASGIMERLVSVESKCGNAISVTEAYVAVGGSSGVVRLFSPSTLEYCATLPFPPAFGAANDPFKPVSASPSVLYPADPSRYAAAIATRITGSHVIVIYSDRSIFIYGTATIDNLTVERSFLYHSGGIRDLQVAGHVRGIDAKDDNTIRLWNLELHRRPAKSSRFELSAAGRSGLEHWKSPHSQEMLRVIYNDIESDFADAKCVVLGGTCSHESKNPVNSPHSWNKGLRTVAVRPDQKEIAAGDQNGNIVVVPMHPAKSATRIKAHSSNVNCLAYSSYEDNCPFFMTSGGQDQLIQLYDCQKGHVLINTIEPHSAAITNLSISREGKILLSSGADNSVVQSDLDARGKVTSSKVLFSSSGKIFGTVFLPDRDTAVVSCNNKLEFLNIRTGNQQRALPVGEQGHLALCPAGHCVAISGSNTNNNIHVIELETGDMLATASGHGDAITALKFTPDCRRLLSASSDSCIFVWRLADDIQTKIKEAPLPPPAPPVTTHSGQKCGGMERTAFSTMSFDRSKVFQPAEADLAAVKIALKKSSKWKGSRVAVPGPLAAIPLEKWMRTRATAKPTIHVIETNFSQLSDEATLLTPEEDSGKVATLSYSKEEMNLMTLNEDAVLKNQVNSLDTEQVNNGEQKADNGSPKTPSKNILAGKDELTSLSLKMVDTSTPTSTSLALEREHLMKRKRQLNTANAVATMNTRLSQLGFLKSPSKVAIQVQSKLPAPSPQNICQSIPMMDSSVSQTELLTTTGCTNENTSHQVRVTPYISDVNQILTHETMEILTTDLQAKKVIMCEDTGANKGVHSVIGDVVAQAERSIEESAKLLPEDGKIVASLGVHDDQQKKKFGKEFDEARNQSNGIYCEKVDASLSSFTSGFVALGSPHIVNKNEILDESTSSSLSPNDYIASAGAQQQMPVDASLSTFVSGYGLMKESVADINTLDAEDIVRPSAVANDTLGSAALEILANLCQPLEVAASNLVKITSCQEQNDAKLLEVKKKIDTLRSTITSMLNK